MGKQSVTTRKQRHTMDTYLYTKVRRKERKQGEPTTDVDNKIVYICGRLKVRGKS